jgi:hypothetical protein
VCSGVDESARRGKERWTALRPFIGATAVWRGGRNRGGSGVRRDVWKEGAGPDQRAASRPCRGPATALTGGAALFEQGAPGAADAWALADSEREEEKRGAEHVGRPGGKENGPSPKE